MGRVNIIRPPAIIAPAGLGIPAPENFLYDPEVDGGYDPAMQNTLPMLDTAYDALDVPDLRSNLNSGSPTSSGGGTPVDFYEEPRTEEIIWKLTDEVTDGGAGGVGPHFGYATGAFINMSYLWVDAFGEDFITIYTFNDQFDGGGHSDTEFAYLRDLRLSDMSVWNKRELPVFSGTGGTSFTFSKNPATPQIAFVLSGNAIVKINTATDTSLGSIHNTAGNDGWLTNSINDDVFGYLIGSGNPRVWVQNAVFGQLADTLLTPSGIVNEHRILQTGQFVFLDRPADGVMAYYDLLTEVTSAETPVDVHFVAHSATLDDFAVGYDAFGTDPSDYWYFSPNGAGVPISTVVGGGLVGMAGMGAHMDGGFSQIGRAFGDKWFVSYGIDGDRGGYAADAVGVIAMDGRKRLICQSYTSFTTYWSHIFPGWSPSGHIIAWGSRMNDTSRMDLFCVKVPTV